MRLSPITSTLLVPLLAGCSGDPESDEAAVEIVARGMTFEAPSRMRSGWNHIRLRNESTMTHFAVLERLPPDRSVQDMQDEVAPVFQAGFDLLSAGDTDAAMAAFGELPPWFGDVVFVGGPGLVSAGGTADVYVDLEPGSYMLECYVKTNGRFHSYNPAPDVWGMVAAIEVTDERSRLTPPKPAAELSIARAGGIRFDAALEPGEQVIAVHFVDQAPHENFVGHDVHLVRLGDDTDLDALEAWMDWRQPTGLQTPAPATFVGGTNEMPAGSTTYLHVTLEPGRYAWIAEVPGAREKGMLVPFDVPTSD